MARRILAVEAAPGEQTFEPIRKPAKRRGKRGRRGKTRREQRAAKQAQRAELHRLDAIGGV